MSHTTDYVRYVVQATQSDHAIYRAILRPSIVAIARKKFRGIYDAQLAKKQFERVAAEGIRKFTKEFCQYYEIPSVGKVPVTVKRAIAAALLRDAMPEIDDFVRDLRSGTVGKPRRKR